MREVISLHLGQAGVAMGASCWELLRHEHEATTTKGDRNDGFFSMFSATSTPNHYRPRAIYADSDPESIDSLLNAQRGEVVREQTVVGTEDASGVYAIGHNAIGRQLAETMIETIRRVAEDCSHLQGFVVQVATAGGTGSALYDLVRTRLSEEFPLCSDLTVSLFPDPAAHTSVVEPFNTVFTTQTLLTQSSISVLYDNEALANLSRRHIGASCPNYANINQIVAQAFSMLTAAMRFDDMLNRDLGTFLINLVPFSVVHFCVQSLSPLQAVLRPYSNSLKLTDITEATMHRESCLASCDVMTGKMMASTLTYRGNVSPLDIAGAVSDARRKDLVKFVQWSPLGYRYGKVNGPWTSICTGDFELPLCSTSMLANSTAVKTLLSTALNRFDRLYSRRSFVHLFTRYGMEEAEFRAARERLVKAIDDYTMIEADDVT